MEKKITPITTIELKETQLYGKAYFYPACEFSEWICSVAKKKSLSVENVEYLEQHFKVEIE